MALSLSGSAEQERGERKQRDGEHHDRHADQDGHEESQRSGHRRHVGGERVDNDFA